MKFSKYRTRYYLENATEERKLPKLRLRKKLNRKNTKKLSKKRKRKRKKTGKRSKT